MLNGIVRRAFVVLTVALALLAQPISAAFHGSASQTITRVLLIGYGQSNMDQLFAVGSGSPPAALSGTSFYDPSIPGVTTVPAADGIRILQNTIKTVTGLPSISMVCAIGGSALNGLTSGGPNANQTGYQGCINQALANILPTDQVFFLWDQGETDSAGAELPDYYAPTVATLHANLAAAIGRTITTAPWITTSKGAVSPDATGNPFFSGFASQFSWSVLVNSLRAITYYDPHAYWFNQYDFARGTDGLHYVATGGTALGGARFARYITNLMGYTSGAPVFDIASAAVVDATHTTLSVPLNLGTDWTPTTGASGTNGVEVSGDNGVTWVNAAHSHASATAITLTHASLSTTNARLVRYLYGANPPNVDSTCGSGGNPGPCFSPTNMIFDNSSLSIPLSPTTGWPMRAAGLTTLPMPTWRDALALTGSGAVQTATGIQLGPEQVRKYLVLSLAGPALAGGGAVSVSSMTITPQDFLGNSVGTPITLTTPTPLFASGRVGLFGTTLNANNANATTFSLSVTYSSGPSNGTIVQDWTIPLADLSSTTPTGANGSTTATSATGTTTLTANSGGFIIAAAYTSAAQSSSTSYSFTGTDAGAHSLPMALRWLIPTGIATMSGDGANVQTSGTASVTANFITSGTVDVAAVAFR